MDAHHPYEPPEEYIDHDALHTDRTRSALGQLSRNAAKSNGTGVSPEEIADVITAYRACCSYLRDELTGFVSELIERGHFDPGQDVFVMTADHGECLTPSKYSMMGHYPPAFWEEVVRVPLAISHPKWESQTTHEQVSLIDLMPTILNAADLPIPDTVEGQARRTPEEMARTNSAFVSRWSGPETSRPSIYRGVRNESGWKQFGLHQNGRDTVVLSRYEREVATNEERVCVLDEEEPPTDMAVKQQKCLLKEIQRRGTSLDTVEDAASKVQANEEHLRNLGYID